MYTCPLNEMCHEWDGGRKHMMTGKNGCAFAFKDVDFIIECRDQDCEIDAQLISDSLVEVS